MKKKLIEVALPLDAINKAAAYEKMPGIGAHPRGLHLWWARRPLTVARAVIWASLVDDPSSHPESFPTEKEQSKERKRLFEILEKLVKWENSNNEHVLKLAKEEIMKSTGGHLPTLLDPFAGGGAIPLEGQRLGLKVVAADLNPVAAMINKAMIEIPARFQNMPPVNPEANGLVDAEYSGAQGLAADIAYYGKILKERAFKKIGHLYPKVKVPETGREATVIAWIWARTVKCPNPACGCEMPLVKSFVLSKKKGHEAYVKPIIGGKNIRYEVRHGKGKNTDGTITRGKAICIACGSVVQPDYIKQCGQEGKMSAQMIAVVSEGERGRIYLSPTPNDIEAAKIDKPIDFPNAELPNDPRNFWTPAYGLRNFGDLFTNRQLTALTTCSDLINEISGMAYHDAINSEVFCDDKTTLADGGEGAWAYGQAVSVFLSLAIDRLADFSTSVSRWAVSNEKAMNLFNKQAIPMTWDYPEVNIMGDSVGSVTSTINYLCKCIETLPKSSADGIAINANAQLDFGLRDIMVSTDPPYYDNIGYADLSDFFYLWMRRNLKNIYPDLFNTILVPKAAELIASPYRHNGNMKTAKDFFEKGMLDVCKQLYHYTQDDIPITLYYAYKQSDSKKTENGQASSGWETMLSAIIQSGLSITGTWPMRTEQAYRAVSMGTNALASSIVLVCRKRPATSAVCTRKNFLRELKSELQTALADLQASNIAPVDMAQSAIGPGISVYSRYEKVLEADGSPMTVRSALKLINQALDEYFHGQGENLDSETRFCIDFYTTYGFNEAAFGEADVLARAKNVAMNSMTASGAVIAAKGKVRLTKPEELLENDKENGSWIRVQRLVKLLADGGISACAESLRDDLGDMEGIKNLAYRLYQIADKKGWAQDGTGYNNLVISWQDILAQRDALRSERPEQGNLF